MKRIGSGATDQPENKKRWPGPFFAMVQKSAWNEVGFLAMGNRTILQTTPKGYPNGCLETPDPLWKLALLT